MIMPFLFLIQAEIRNKYFGFFYKNTRKIRSPGVPTTTYITYLHECYNNGKYLSKTKNMHEQNYIFVESKKK